MEDFFKSVVNAGVPRTVFFPASNKNNLAAGTTSVKELILPTNFCSDFKDTDLWLSRSSLREANLIFLSGGIKNSDLTESITYPKKIGACVGTRVYFWRPMK